MINKYTPSRIFQYFTLLILLLLTMVVHLITKFSVTNTVLPNNKPEYIAKLVTARLFGPQGILKYKIVSHEAIKYPNLNQVLLNKFDLEGYDINSALNYKLSAKQGWYNYNDSTGYIGSAGHLIIFNKTMPKESTLIDASMIYLNLNQHITNSSQKVKISQGSSTITADGFVYNEIKQVLYLKSNVEINYAP